MTSCSSSLRVHRKAIAVCIILSGLLGALAIYLSAGLASANPLGYEPEDSKRYLREMEVYGGSANMVASGIRGWFDSLWHGKHLAFTVLTLTLLFSLFFLVATTPLPSPPPPPAASHPTHHPSS